jgi:hypothetical protein
MVREAPLAVLLRAEDRRPAMVVARFWFARPDE